MRPSTFAALDFFFFFLYQNKKKEKKIFDPFRVGSLWYLLFYPYTIPPELCLSVSELISCKDL
jgi:hypothetical protein